MSYEYELAMGTDKNGVPATATNGQPPVEIVQNVNGGGALVAGLGLGAIAAVVLGFLALSVALPFGIGAVGGAITGPKGHKKEAAKKAAIYGGLAGIGSGIVLSVVSGALESARPGAGRYIGGSGLVPFAVGLYIGYKQREKHI